MTEELTFRKGISDGIPIALGYLSVSIAFGLQAVSCGLSPLEAWLISALNLTSAGQVAGVTLMASGAPLLEMALTQLTINIRYALMSLSLSQKLDGSMTTPHRLAFSFANTDEIFAVASGQRGELNRRYLYGLMITPWIGWTSGTLIGAVAGSLLPEFIRLCLGIAIYGMFVAVVLPPAKEKKSVRVVVLLAAALSMMTHWLPGLKNIPGGYAMILCAVIAAGVGAALFPLKEGEG